MIVAFAFLHVYSTFQRNVIILKHKKISDKIKNCEGEKMKKCFLYFIIILLCIGTIFCLLFDVTVFIKQYSYNLFQTISEHMEDKIQIWKTPNSSTANWDLGLNYIGINNEKAFKYISKAIEINPNDKGANVAMAQYYHNIDNNGKAAYYYEKVYERNLQKDVSNLYLYYLLLATEETQDKTIKNNYLNKVKIKLH